MSLVKVVAPTSGRNIQQPEQPTSATSGLRTISESSSPDSQHLQYPGFAQPKHPATTTANTCNIEASHSRSIQQPGQPTPATSRLRTAGASSSPDNQHLQHPGFAQPQIPADQTANIYSIQVSHNRSIQQLKLSASTTSELRTTSDSSSPDSQHLQYPGFAQPEHPTTETLDIYNIRASHNLRFQQPRQPTSTVSRFRTTGASNSPDSQHLQHPGFAQPEHPATQTANIYSIQVSHNPSIQKLQQPTSSVSRFRRAEAFRDYNTQHLQYPGFAEPKHPGITTPNIFSIQVFAQPKHPGITTPNIFSIQVLHSPSIQELQQSTSATSGFCTTTQPGN